MVKANRMMQTEIGLVPDDWQINTISEIITEISMGPFGSDIKVSNFTDKGVPVLNGYNVSGIKLKDRHSNFVTKEKAKDLKKAVAKRGDIVVTHRGTIGQIAYIPYNSQYEEYVISQSQFRFSLNNKKALPEFLVYFFHSDKGQNIISETKGHTGVPAIAQATTTFKKITIPLPPIPEQKAITKALSDCDTLIESLEKIIAKKCLIKQGAMRKLLTTKKDWETKKLGEIAQIKKGQMITSSTCVEGIIPVIAGGKTPAYFHNVANRFGKTITISASGANAGYVCFHNYPIFASDCSTIVESKNYCLEFVYYFLLKNQEVIYGYQTGGAQPHIHPKDIEPILICLPSITEQTHIAKILSDMDAEIKLIEQKLSKARQIKQGMMQELLTGKTRLV
jgi:type I restriction enzyme S subunit